MKPLQISQKRLFNFWGTFCFLAVGLCRTIETLSNPAADLWKRVCSCLLFQGPPFPPNLRQSNYPKKPSTNTLQPKVRLPHNSCYTQGGGGWLVCPSALITPLVLMIDGSVSSPSNNGLAPFPSPPLSLPLSSPSGERQRK